MASAVFLPASLAARQLCPPDSRRVRNTTPRVANKARDTRGVAICKKIFLLNDNGEAIQGVIYDGAGHAFMRSGEAPNASEANRAAWKAAWDRWLALLRP